MVDAMMERYRHRAHLIDLDSPDPERVLFGPVVTISFLTVREDLMDEEDRFGLALARALSRAEIDGAVLVMASNDHADIALGDATDTDSSV